MSAYVVRTIKEKHLIGIVVLDTLDDLIMTIDEVIDPGQCEFSKLSSPGGVFIKKVMKPGDSWNPYIVAEPCEQWNLEDENAKWTPVTAVA
jgi:hypothetical protein